MVIGGCYAGPNEEPLRLLVEIQGGRLVSFSAWDPRSSLKSSGGGPEIPVDLNALLVEHYEERNVLEIEVQTSP